MQTFMISPSFISTAEHLDYRRLGKQRVEAKQIMMVLTGESTGWSHHPAVKMWIGYEYALAQYGLAMCDEWISKGYEDNLSSYFIDKERELYNAENAKFITSLPPWINDEDFLLSHRSNLLRKDPAFYGRYGWDVPDDLPYVWPVSDRGIVVNYGVQQLLF